MLWFTGINTTLTGTSGKIHPCPKVSGEGQGWSHSSTLGTPVAAGSSRQPGCPVGVGDPTVVWGPRANSPLQKTRDVDLGLLQLYIVGGMSIVEL